MMAMLEYRKLIYPRETDDGSGRLKSGDGLAGEAFRHSTTVEQSR